MSNLLDRIRNWLQPDTPASQPASSLPPADQPQSAQQGAGSAAPVQAGIQLPSQADAAAVHEAFLCATLGLDVSQVPAPDKAAVAVIRQQLKLLSSAEGRRKTVPRLPAVVPQFLRSLRDPNTSATDFVGIVTRDPVLTTNVLRLVNSAYYNPAGKAIDSIHRAVVVLGLDGLRFAVSSAVMHPILETGSTEFSNFGPALWQHSQDCALICQLLAPQAGALTFEAYLAGMVHEVGTVTLFNQLNSACREAGVPAASAMIHTIRAEGKKLCHAIVRDWQLPPAIATAVAEQAAAPSGASALGRLLYRANHLAEAYYLRTIDAQVELPGDDLNSEEVTRFFARLADMRERISRPS